MKFHIICFIVCSLILLSSLIWEVSVESVIIRGISVILCGLGITVHEIRRDD